MSSLFRSSWRTATRLAPRAQARGLATNAENVAMQNYLTLEAAKRAHAKETTDLWRKISYYVCLPAIVVCTAWVYNFEKEHAAHIAHLTAENDGVRPEPPQYDYLNRRSKPFPWGNNSLFFNGHINKDMNVEE